MSVAWTSSTAEMDRIFGYENEVQRWLDFEAALARAEARHGLIPAAAAEEISRKARVELLDLDELRHGIRDAVHPIVPLVRLLGALCEGDTGEYVHWGATTQDVIDTGLVLRLREAEAVISRDLSRLVDVLTERAQAHRTTAMAGRTHSQQAIPITFGYKLAVWVDELTRHRRTLEDLRPGTFVGQFGGATGTLASIGPVGLAVRADLMRELGLAEPAITWHVARDRLVHFAFVLGLVAASLQRAAAEIITLQRTEVGELAEPSHLGKVGSSTMPHKRNPVYCESMWTLGELVRNDVRTGLSSLGSLHERDKAVYTLEVDYLPRVCRHTHRLLELALQVFEGLTVDAERMRANIDRGDGGIFSEHVMMTLARRIGRQRAHDIVYEVAMEAYERRAHLRDALAAHPVVAEALAPDELQALFTLGPAVETAALMVDEVCPPTA
jgi:3-carboxy-cis,cis-muconate cycloisomerase